MALTKIDDRGLKTPIDLLDNEKIRFGTGNDLEIYHNGSNTYLDNNTGTLILTSAGDVELSAADDYTIYGVANGAVYLYWDGSRKLETKGSGVGVTGQVTATTYLNIPNDTGKVLCGTGNDLQIYHDGSSSHIQNATGDLIQKSTGWISHACDNGQYWYNHAINTAYARLDSDGLKFNGDTAAANGLDDYEEGTYQPTVNTNLSLNSSYNKFSYVKIGKLCHVRGLFYPASPSGTDTVTFSLPFASFNFTGTGASVAGAGGQSVMFNYIDGADAGLAVYIDDNTSSGKFYRLEGGNANWSVLQNNHFQSNAEIYLSFSYFTV